MKSIRRVFLFLIEKIRLLKTIRADSVCLYLISLLIAGHNKLFYLEIIKLTLIRPPVLMSDNNIVKTVF